MNGVFAVVHNDYLAQAQHKSDKPLANVRRFKVKARDIARRLQFTPE